MKTESVHVADAPEGGLEGVFNINKELARLQKLPPSPLSGISMWTLQQCQILKNPTQFASNDFYIHQEHPLEDYEEYAEYVHNIMSLPLPFHCTRDAQFGAMIYETKALGKVTRSWMDSITEIAFLERHLSKMPERVLDIGAGYGRFAVALQDRWPTSDICCVDAVPISTCLCEYYTQTFNPKVRVITPHAMPNERPILAVNIHSWNECAFEHVYAWLGALWAAGTEYLFVVSNDETWYTENCGLHPEQSFRPLIEAGYDLIAEENLGIKWRGKQSPHTLWRRKNGQ